MRLTVLGGSGAFPTADHACSGFLLEHEGFRAVIDLGYGTFQRLLRLVPAESVDAVVITHGHPDHCADLHPLLRARAMSPSAPSRLDVHAPAGALDAVLALDRPGMLDRAYQVLSLEDRFELGPFSVEVRWLPHSVPNAGVRITAGGHTVAYTGDTGPSPLVVELARDADLLVAEASFAYAAPDHLAEIVSCASQAGRDAARAGVGRLLLTHLWPGSDPAEFVAAAGENFPGKIGVSLEPGDGVVTLPAHERNGVP